MTTKKNTKTAVKVTKRLTGTETISVLKRPVLKGNRAKKLALIRSGMSVSAAKAAMEKKGLRRASGFLQFCRRRGVIVLKAK
jgi:hypothetical protein